MKTKLSIAVLVLVSMMLLTSCGDSGIGTGYTGNEYLNQLPSIAKDYGLKIEAKEKEIHACTDMDDAFKLEKELELLKEEWGAKIKESHTANPVYKPLPFEEMANAPYKVRGLQVEQDKVYKSNVTIKFDIMIPRDIKDEYGSFEKNLFVFFQALDKAGNEIPEVISVATNSIRNELRAGTTLVVTGQLGPLAKLEDFARLRLISREEYEKRRK